MTREQYNSGNLTLPRTLPHASYITVIQNSFWSRNGNRSSYSVCTPERLLGFRAA